MTRTEQQYRKALRELVNLQGTLHSLSLKADDGEESDALKTILSAITYAKGDIYDAAKAGGHSLSAILR